MVVYKEANGFLIQLLCNEAKSNKSLIHVVYVFINL